MVVLLKGGLLIDPAGIKRPSRDGLRGAVQCCLVALVVLVCPLAEGGVRVHGGWVVDARGVADGGGAEDVAVLAFVHLKRTLKYYRNGDVREKGESVKMKAL